MTTLDLELEIEVKVIKLPQSEEEREELQAIKVNKGELDLSDLPLEYKKLVINLKDIDAKGEFDADHTLLYLPYGAFIAKVPFRNFMAIYETITGKVVRKIGDFQINYEKKAEKKPTRKRFSEDEE